MLISELIEQLEVIKESQGDLEVLVKDNEWATHCHLGLSVKANKVIIEIEG